MKKYDVCKEWITKSGYKGVVVKIYSDDRSYAWHCGYIGIDKNHPLFNKDYTKHYECLKYLLEKMEERNPGKRGTIPLFLSAIEGGRRASMDVVFNVHGSITFAETSDDKASPLKTKIPLYFIGFDCNHAGDTMEKCNLNYCLNECESLAEQLKKVENEPTRTNK